MRVLVVEDDDSLRRQIGERLREAGFAVDLAGEGVDGTFMAEEYALDLAVVDLGLPGVDGLELIRRVRAAGRSYPVLILTARDRWQQKVEGLEAGADDYLTKPFHMEEMLARIRALLRRSKGMAQSAVSRGPVSLDTSSQSVSVDGRAVDLTGYEYRLLEYLMLHPGKVITKSELADHVYEEDAERDSNVIEVFIGRLRRKLDPDGEINPIETLRGRGYRLSLS